MSNDENQEQADFVKTPFVPMSKSMNRRPWKIVSGGQTGVDRAGLVAAMSFSIATGGWVPCGRLAEDGVVPEGFYTLQESPSGGFRERTRRNVVDSDATLILVDALPLVGGPPTPPTTPRRTGAPARSSSCPTPTPFPRSATGCSPWRTPCGPGSPAESC